MSIAPIFLFFPMVCLSYLLCGNKYKRLSAVVLGFLFIVFFSWSANGADYDNYKALYREVIDQNSLFISHGEPGYSALVFLMTKMGIPYHVFRMVFLAFLSILTFSVMYKRSPSFPLSLFFSFTMFIVYMISAYRQFFVIAGTLFFYEKYLEGKKKFAFFGSLILPTFHILGLLPLVFLTVSILSGEDRIIRFAEFISKKIWLLFLVALVLRILFIPVYQFDIVRQFFGYLVGGYSSTTPQLLTFGFLARSFFLFIISYLFCHTRKKDLAVELYYSHYAIAMLFYIAVPLELIMGRAMNTFYYFLVFLAPCLSLNQGTPLVLIEKKIVIKNCEMLLLGIMCAAAFSIFIRQLLAQSGYYPYYSLFSLLHQ